MREPTRRPINPADMDDAITRYLAGEGGLNAISASIGISNTALKTELRRRGLAPRTASDAQRNRHIRDADTDWVQRFKAASAATRERWVQSPENRERFRQLGADAERRNVMRPHSEESRARRALAMQPLTLKVSPTALKLNEWLSARGVETVMEAASGRYNVDIAVGPIAVEVHPYSFNPLGPTRRRERQRTRYLCNRGWLVLYVWISARSYILDELTADYIVALAEQAQRDPSLIGQYRVIRGTSEFVTEGRPDGDEWA